MTQSPMMLDILIVGGTLLTMDNDLSVINDALIGIADGKILFTVDRSSSNSDPSFVYETAETIHADGCLILPGLINTHTHAPMVAFRGMADDLSLMDWLNNHIFPAEAMYVDADMVYHGSILAIAEMILSGTTTFADGYFFENRIAQAAESAGIRAVAAEGFIDFSPPDDKSCRKHLHKAEAFIRQWSDSSLVTPALFCHSPYTCASQTLRCLKEYASSAGVPYFIHVAETREEIKKMLASEGASSVRYLHRLGVLDETTVAIHCVWVDDEEIHILSDCGVKVSHTPESNMKLACGIAPIPKMLSADVTVGLGTDGAASNNNLDMLLEMDTAAKVHKVATMDPTVASDAMILWMATRGGAKVLGLDQKIGSIEKGKQADLILIDTQRPHLTPFYNPYSLIVYSAGGADVTTAIINGRVVMKDRILLTIDLEPSLAKIRGIAERIHNK